MIDILRALERLAIAEERRNELLEQEAAWRRESFQRDQELAAQRWSEITAATNAPHREPEAS